MSEYLVNTVGRVIWTGILLIGLPLVAARLLHIISDKIRSIGCGYGRVYWYFVAIGVACHETGHAVGAWITGNRVLEFVPFAIDRDDAPYPNTLGWIRHTISGGVWGEVSEAIICTGPIWFGSIVILLLTRFLVGQEMTISYYDYFMKGELPGLFSYLAACLRCTILLCCEIAGGALFSGWKIFVWTYFVFCIASEIGMSDVDFKLARKGLALIIGSVLVLLFIPFIGKLVTVGVTVLLPKLFIVHVLMMLAVLINMGFLFLEKFIVRIT